MTPLTALGIAALLLALYRTACFCMPGWRERVRWGRSATSARVSTASHLAWLLMLYLTAGILLAPLAGLRVPRIWARNLLLMTYVAVTVTVVVDWVTAQRRRKDEPAEGEDDEEDEDEKPSPPPSSHRPPGP